MVFAILSNVFLLLKKRLSLSGNENFNPPSKKKTNQFFFFWGGGGGGGVGGSFFSLNRQFFSLGEIKKSGWTFGMTGSYGRLSTNIGQKTTIEFSKIWLFWVNRQKNNIFENAIVAFLVDISR